MNTPKRRGPGQPTIKAEIMDLASRPEGMRAQDITTHKAEDISARLCAFVNEGLLFRGLKAWGNTRFFTDPEAAKASAASLPKAAPKPVPIGNGTFAKSAEVVYTPETKVTICPGYKPRYEAHTLPFVQTANQAGRVVAEVGE
jgi:hypothetical protein